MCYLWLLQETVPYGYYFEIKKHLIILFDCISKYKLNVDVLFCDMHTVSVTMQAGQFSLVICSICQVYFCYHAHQFFTT